MAGMRKFRCYACQHEWEEPYGTGRPAVCPKCGNNNIHRADSDRGRRGQAGGYGGGRGPSDEGRGRGGLGRGPRVME
jgi:predicted RNA-binding Zn-ribbon protein involved in translation (DUF1610 family)